MKALFKLLAVVFILLQFGCGKTVFVPAAAFILKYDAGADSYTGYAEYKVGNSNFQLIPGRTIATLSDPSSDSVLMHYNSILQDKSNKPLVAISFQKYFLKTQMDSIEGGWVPKNEVDFYDAFKTGILEIQHLQNKQGVNIILNTTTNPYVFQNSFGFVLPTPAHLDTFNHFEITEVKYNNATSHEIDWVKLYIDNIIRNSEARVILVKFNFKCKLFNTNAPHDSIHVTNGVFQGFFADR